MKKNTDKAFLSIGIIFLIVGFVQQDFTISFKSGLFNIGVIFTLSGLAAIALEKKRNQDKK